MRKYSNIRARLMFLALVPTASVIVVLTAFFTYFRAAEIDFSLEQRGATIAHHFARAAEFGLFSGDRVALQSVADDARREPDVEAVTIFNARSELVAQSGSPHGSVADKRQLRFTEPVLQAMLQFSDLPDAVGTTASRQLGEVHVEMSRVSTEKAKRDVWRLAFLFGVCCLAAAAFVAHVIGGGVSAPIQQQAEAIRSIAAGDLSVRVREDIGGELGALASGINRMAASLHESQRGLEDRIAQATHKLQAQKDSAEEANAAKSRFLASASHDLRQPLHAIELFSAALRRKVKGRETRELSEKLEQAVFSMDSLFNALLDIYQLDAGVLKPVARPFPVQDLFNSLDTEFRGTAESRGLQFRLVPTTKVAVSDPILVRQILANLITNALRYTPQGTVLVACRRDAANLRIEVKDTGPGIAEDELSNIFREFYRIEGSRNERGMGLGLTIVTRIAALLHSKVVVRSKLSRGSTFSIALDRGPDRTTLPLESRGRMQSLRSPRLGVLFVDNDPLVLQSALALTREWRINVKTADSCRLAHETVKRMTQETILVITDLWLSNQENGLQLLANLKAEARQSLFGVVVTGDTRPDTVQLVQAAGYPVLHKPVSAAKLRATLMYYVSKAYAKKSNDESSAT